MIRAYSKIILCLLLFMGCILASSVSKALENGSFNINKFGSYNKTDSKINPLITKTLQARDRFITLQNENPKANQVSTPFVKINDSGAVQVYLYLTGINNEVLSLLKDINFEVEIINKDLNMIQGWLSEDSLNILSENEHVLKISPPSYGFTKQGTVKTEGDEVLNSDDVRDMLGIDGAGVIVGVISDGVDSLIASQVSGNLPDVVTVLKPGIGDEGTAMLETIHDIAPGAELCFSDGFSSSMAFMKSVDDLINICDVDIIVDDVGFLLEPYFQNGTVAQKVDEAVSNGVIFVTAAGNNADEHYQHLFVQEVDDDELNLHDFGFASGGPSEISIPILVGGTDFAPNNFIAAVLQWSDPFGGSSNDYDLFLFDDEGVQIDSSTAIQDGSQDPVEVVLFTNNSPNIVMVDLVINRFSGVPRVLELQFNGVITLLDFNVPTDSIFGHSGAQGAVSVGAVPHFDPNTIEDFSSRGPVSIHFGPLNELNSINSSSGFTEISNNTPIETRMKPDVVAPDGTSTSLSGFSPFFGTSVSAPHVAGVLALMIDANPQLEQISANTELNSKFNEKNIINNPNAFINILKNTAVDLGAPGPENTFGSGRVDAFAAVQQVLSQSPSPTPTTTPIPTPTPTTQPSPTPTTTPSGSGDTTSSGCSVTDANAESGIFNSFLTILVLLTALAINKNLRNRRRDI